MSRPTVLLVPLLLLFVHFSQERDEYHPFKRFLGFQISTAHHLKEISPTYWFDEAQEAIKSRASHGTGMAKNVVMFLGDGMSIPTLTAARTLLGQRLGNTGEEARLSFEEFPSVGLSKTYCVDAQTPDSACSATAYLCGTKANYGTIGVDATVYRANCYAATETPRHVHSIATWALAEGKDVGIVTTTRVTHASPAGMYAHTSERDWESDADVFEVCGLLTQEDIASQLVHSYPGNQFKVILGGGRREFLPNTMFDEELTKGKRVDGRNLIKEWQTDKQARNASFKYVWNREQLMYASESLPEYLLGLFEGSHMQYNMEANPETEPTLAELTEIAIKSLSRNDKGFFLFVEGGRIDHAHHDNYVHLALDETIQLSEAVAKATELLSKEDTLIVVTSDHAHVMTLNGYAKRGSDILGSSTGTADDGVPYMTLSYANGPGFRPQTAEGTRDDITEYNYKDVKFAYPAMVPMFEETHGGDDVAVFARGPQHNMFSGLYEQSQIPHLMAYAACIGPGRHACEVRND